MNSRFLISVLCVGAVVYACGPRARSDASTTSSKGTTKVATAERTAGQQGDSQGSRKSVKPGVAAQLSVRANDSTVRLALHVVNNGKKRVELRFPTGQTHDFIILDSLGREVWRWGSGRMFTQTLQNKLLTGGQALDVNETWTSASLKAGTYVARAVLKSENYPLTRETTFTVTGTTLASR